MPRSKIRTRVILLLLGWASFDKDDFQIALAFWQNASLARRGKFGVPCFRRCVARPEEADLDDPVKTRSTFTDTYPGNLSTPQVLVFAGHAQLRHQSKSTAIMNGTVEARPEYPPAVPGRFMPDGTASHNPGNTLICMVQEGSEIYRGLKAVYDALAEHPVLSKKVHVMPPDSWHMTMLDCVGEDNREPGWWPAGKEQQPLDQCTREFAARLRNLEGALEVDKLSPPYRVKGTGFDIENGFGIGLCVEDADAGEEQRLRRLRDLLADTIGFRDLRHESYAFHVTICYFIRYVEGEDRLELVKLLESLLPRVCIEFELGSVAFCGYEDLEVFKKLFFVGEKGA